MAKYLIDDVLEALCESGTIVTRIILGRVNYANFCLNNGMVDRQADGKFIGGIAVEMGYFEEGIRFWKAPETATSNKENLILLLQAVREAGLEINKLYEQGRPNGYER